MRVDADDLQPEAVLQADVCIIGAGPAGITVARELDGSGLTVLLLEGGGLDRAERSAELYQGTSTGIPFGGIYTLENTRVRFLGGGTNRWGGVCRPFQAADFEPQPWLGHPGWPIGLDDLADGYRRAVELLGMPSAQFDPHWWVDQGLAQPLPFPEGPLWAAAHQVRQLPFASAFGEELRTSRDISLVINANATHLAIEPEGSQITAVDMVTYGGAKWQVQAGTFVLAMGGIENPRLMLASNDVRTAGIGNEYDQVGRYFNDHVHTHAGFAILRGDPASNAGLVAQEVAPGEIPSALMNAITLSQDMVRTEGLVMAGAQFVAQGLPEGAPQQADGIDVAQVGALFDRLEGSPPMTITDILVGAEQRLDPESRVQLNRERDPLGVPRVDLHWTQDEVETRAIERLVGIIAQQLLSSGVGRAQLVAGDVEAPPDTGYWAPPSDYEVVLDHDPSLALEASNHHMCTTRMSASQTTGVVDADCRVHGVPNLYVAGSSVFASGGIAPPTFTILALALRLADTLKASAVRRG